MRRLAVVLAGIGVLFAACDTPSPSPTEADPSTPAAALVLVPLTDLEVVPQTEASILAAFDAVSATALVTSVPDSVDFSQVGIICVYLGERSTGGWAVALQSASLVNGELQIRARETRPPATGGPAGTTFPAGCGTITRAGLPVGELDVRADDTVSEEFIVDGVITVPAP